MKSKTNPEKSDVSKMAEWEFITVIPPQNNGLTITYGGKYFCGSPEVQ